MIRLSLIAALAGLLFCGCGRIDGSVADQAAAEGVGAAGSFSGCTSVAGTHPRRKLPPAMKR